jgi:ATP-dependent HslUV protease subunit HslV
MKNIQATTILAIKYNGKLVMIGDGQVTVGNTIMKHTTNKIRTLQKGEVLAGFAGSAADAFTLYERFEAKLNEHNGQLARAAVELAKNWRTDKYLRKLEAMLIIADKEALFLLSGNGDVIQPDDNVLAIGSGGNYALAAARALVRSAEKNGKSGQLSAREIAEISMQIAAELCVFTNNNFHIEEINC